MCQVSSTIKQVAEQFFFKKNFSWALESNRGRYLGKWISARESQNKVTITHPGPNPGLRSETDVRFTAVRNRQTWCKTIYSYSPKCHAKIPSETRPWPSKSSGCATAADGVIAYRRYNRERKINTNTK